MYSMVLMAALTTGTDLPDMGRRRGGGCGGGCYGGMAYGGCYGGCGGGYGGCYGGWGGGYGGCYGGWGGGYGGCYGGGYASGGCGGGYGGYVSGGCYGGSGLSWGGWGGGYSGHVWGGASPWMGGYAYSPMIYNNGTPVLAGNMNMVNPGTQSFFYNPGTANQGNEATIIVHLPDDANLTVDGQPTRSTSGTRTFLSPPLEPGKTYTYTLRAEINRDGRMREVKKNVDVRAGQSSDVTLDFGIRNRDDESNRPGAPNDEVIPNRERRTLPRDREPNPLPRDQ